MKSNLSILLLVAAFLLGGCRENYLAEKEFWKATRKLKSSSAEPSKEIKAKTDASLIEAFEAVVNRYPGTPKAIQSLWVIADLKSQQKDYEGARASLERIVQNYSHTADAPVKARAAIAALYEMEAQWGKAVAMYWEMAELHPLHPKGLAAPSKILWIYRQQNQKEKAEKTYARAQDHFDRLLKQSGPIQAAASLKYYYALTHLAQGDWSKARDLWLNVADQHSDSPYAPVAYLHAAELTQEQEGAQKALAMFELFYQKYPQHQLARQVAVQMGKNCEELKDYPKSRSWYGRALSFQSSDGQIMELKLLIGYSFQLEGLWEEAQKIYSEVEIKSPRSLAALQIPLLRASYYQSLGETEKSNELLNEAIHQYERHKDSLSDIGTHVIAEKFQNIAYAQKGEWDRVLMNYDERFNKAATDQVKGVWLFLKARLTEERIKNRHEALLLYENFLKHFPEHPLIDIAKSRQKILSQPV